MAKGLAVAKIPRHACPMSEPFDLSIRGAEVITPQGRIRADVGVRDGVIAAIAPDLCCDHEVDATGKLLLPGGVDVHCHIEQMSGMGLMNADTFETATRSAAMGGTTTVVSFAAQAQGQSLRVAVDDYAARAKRGALVDHAFHIIVADASVDDLDDDLAALIAQGHRSIKLFTTYNIGVDDATILRVMAVAREAGALVCVHAENDAMLGLAKKALLARGMTAPKHHALSHPRLAEVEAVERMCRFAEFMDTPVMLFHISCAEALEAVRRARHRGVPIWAETCPHYLLSTAEVLDKDGVEGAKWMCSPPQRDRADARALWNGLGAEDLQVVSSDHAPYRYDNTGKLLAGPTPDFPDIANGMPGLEVRMPLMFDGFTQHGLSVEQMVQACCDTPARIYGLTGKGRIEVGYDADLVVWDRHARHTYGADDLHDNTGYNPWEGHDVIGWPQVVILRGEVIVQNGDCRAKAGQGRWIERDAIGVGGAGQHRDLAFMEGGA